MAESNFRCPQEWSEWSEWLATGLDGRCQWRLPILLVGILFARGRRTVTTWLRAAGISDDYQDYYYFIASVGRNARSVSSRLLDLVLEKLPLPERVLAVLDDTPTKRYGPRVEGASLHHNPTPGPADQKFLYGHIWVTLSLAIRHPSWGTIGLPLRAMLYVRQIAMEKIPPWRGWKFRTKLELAARLVEWIAPRIIKGAKKQLWVVADGFYAKRLFLERCRHAGAIVVSRLRKDAALRDLPGPRRPRRGRPRIYGTKCIDLAKRAGQSRGWQTVSCILYGQQHVKMCKTFLATYRPAGGVIRVVLVREEHGWFALFCTDPRASAVEILEAFADRATIEQDFHDVKEVWGTGQQQVRNIWTNVGVYHLNLWMHTLVELWAWRRSHAALSDRSASPWDDPERRPSHADRRKALRQLILQTELSTVTRVTRLPRKILRFAQRLVDLAA